MFTGLIEALMERKKSSGKYLILVENEAADAERKCSYRKKGERLTKMIFFGIEDIALRSKIISQDTYSAWQ